MSSVFKTTLVLLCIAFTTTLVWTTWPGEKKSMDLSKFYAATGSNNVGGRRAPLPAIVAPAPATVAANESVASTHCRIAAENAQKSFPISWKWHPRYTKVTKAGAFFNVRIDATVTNAFGVDLARTYICQLQGRAPIVDGEYQQWAMSEDGVRFE